MSALHRLASTLPWRNRDLTDHAREPEAHFVLAIPTFRQAVGSVEVELRRARRYERPVTALVLSAETHALPPRATLSGRGQSATHVSAAESENALFFLLGALLQDTVREFDIVSYAAEYHVYALFLPEADHAQAYIAALRISDSFHQRTGAHLKAGAATFPGDGLTVRDLLARAHEAWRDRPVFPHLSAPSQEAMNANL